MLENKNVINESEIKSVSVESVQSDRDLELRQKARVERDQKVLEEIKRVFEIVPKAKKQICFECMKVFPLVRDCTNDQFEELHKQNLHLSFTEKYFDGKIRCIDCYFEKFHKTQEDHNLEVNTKLAKKLLKQIKPIFICPKDHDNNQFNSRDELKAHLVKYSDCLKQMSDHVEFIKEQKRKTKKSNSYNHFMSSGAE